MYVCIYTQVYIMHTCKHVHLDRHLCTCIYIYIHIVCVFTYRRREVDVYVCLHVRKYVCMYTYFTRTYKSECHSRTNTNAWASDS